MNHSSSHGSASHRFAGARSSSSTVTRSRNQPRRRACALQVARQVQAALAPRLCRGGPVEQLPAGDEQAHAGAHNRIPHPPGAIGEEHRGQRPAQARDARVVAQRLRARSRGGGAAGGRVTRHDNGQQRADAKPCHHQCRPERHRTGTGSSQPTTSAAKVASGTRVRRRLSMSFQRPSGETRSAARSGAATAQRRHAATAAAASRPRAQRCSRAATTS